MVLRRIIIFLVVAAGVSTARVRNSMAYSFVDIHAQITSSLSIQTRATSVNADGVVVGDFDDLTRCSGFVLSNNLVQLLPSPDAFSPLQHWDCHAAAINNGGMIVGWCELLEEQDDPHNFTLLDMRATLWNGQPYGLTFLPRIPDSSQQQALGINEQGQVVGAYQVPGDQFFTGVGRAFAWDATDGIRPVPALHGHGFGHLVDCSSSGIDGRGRIVGNCNDPYTGRQRGFINDGNKTMPLPRGHEAAESSISIVGISESGLILGVSEDSTGQHTWIVNDHHVMPIPALDGYRPVRVVNSGAILAQGFPDTGFVIASSGAIQYVAGPSMSAVDMNESGLVVGYLIGPVLTYAAEWVR